MLDIILGLHVLIDHEQLVRLLEKNFLWRSDQANSGKSYYFKARRVFHYVFETLINQKLY